MLIRSPARGADRATRRVRLRRRGARRAPRPAAPADAWFAYVYVRDNPKGTHDECGSTSPAAAGGSASAATRVTHEVGATVDRRRRRERRYARRLPSGGASTARGRSRFSFDGVRYKDTQGDTLASALLANGVHWSRAASSTTGRAASTRRRRGAQRARPARRGARAEPEHSRHRRWSSPTASSPRARICWPVAALRRRRRQRRCSRRSSRRGSTTRRSCGRSRWLRLRARVRRAAGMGARRSSPTPTATSTSTRIATCWSSAPGAAGVAAARAAAAAVPRHPSATSDLAQPVDAIGGRHGALSRTTVFGYLRRH